MAKVIDLFCGAGGFSKGFYDEEGYEILLGVDNAFNKMRTYVKNIKPVYCIRDRKYLESEDGEEKDKIDRIEKDNKFDEKYINQLLQRVDIWNHIHRIKSNNEIFNSYVYFLTQNHNLLIKNEYKLVNNMNSLIQDNNETTVIFLNFLGEKLGPKHISSFLTCDTRIRDLICKIYKYNSLTTANYEPLMELIKNLIDFIDLVPELKNITIIPTREYLSIFNGPAWGGNNIAYLYYNYHRELDNKAIFCFSCDFKELNSSENELITKYINKAIQEADKKYKPSSGKSTVLQINKCDSKELMPLLKLLLIQSCTG